MAISNSVKTLFPGFGNSTAYASSIGVSLTINTTVSTALTGWNNACRSGKVRIKNSAAPASSQITGILISVTDGTTTVNVYQDAIARTAATLTDFMWSFITDINFTTVTVAITTANAGTAQTVDIEFAGNP